MVEQFTVTPAHLALVMADEPGDTAADARLVTDATRVITRLVQLRREIAVLLAITRQHGQLRCGTYRSDPTWFPVDDTATLPDGEVDR